ncbi:MAG: hypothetical protein AAF682_07340 [Planctomycetota bacterium]
MSDHRRVKRSSDEVIPESEAGGGVSTLELLVQDGSTGASLENVLIVRRGEWDALRRWHPGPLAAGEVFLEGRASPLSIPWEPRVPTAETLWIWAPGYAWAQVDVDAVEPGERLTLLREGGEMTLTIEGASALPPELRGKVRFRLRTESSGASEDTAPTLVLDVGLERWRSARQSKSKDRGLELHLRGLPVGRYWASLEVGIGSALGSDSRVLLCPCVETMRDLSAMQQLSKAHFGMMDSTVEPPPLVLVQDEFDVSSTAGRKALRVGPLPQAPPTQRVRTRVVVPPNVGVPSSEIRVSVHRQDAFLRQMLGRGVIRMPLDESHGHSIRSGVHEHSADLPDGTYEVLVSPFMYREIVEIGPAGREISIEIPDLVDVNLELVDRSTGAPLDVSRVTLTRQIPESEQASWGTCSNGSWSRSIKAQRGSCAALLVPGTFAVSCRLDRQRDRSWSHVDVESIVVDSGAQHHVVYATVTEHPYCELRLALYDGVAKVPFDMRWLDGLLRPVGHDGRILPRGGGLGSKSVALSGPGEYEIDLGKLPSFAHQPPICFRIEAGQSRTIEVNLKRGR